MRVLGRAAPLAVTALLPLLPPCLVTAQPNCVRPLNLAITCG